MDGDQCLRLWLGWSTRDQAGTRLPTVFPCLPVAFLICHGRVERAEGNVWLPAQGSSQLLGFQEALEQSRTLQCFECVSAPKVWLPGSSSAYQNEHSGRQAWIKAWFLYLSKGFLMRGGKKKTWDTKGAELWREKQRLEGGDCWKPRAPECLEKLGRRLGKDPPC